MYILVEHGSYPRRVAYRTAYESHLDGHDTIDVADDGPQVGWYQREDGSFFDPYAPVPKEPGQEPPVE